MLAKLFAPVALASLFTTFAAPVQAAEVIAKYTIDAGSDFHHAALADVTLESDGHLTAVKTAYDLTQGRTQPLVTSEQTAITQLDATTLATVLRQVQMLSAAEVQTTRYGALCMMMPPFGADRHILQVRRGYDWQTKGFAGDLVTVDNNAGCWQALHVQPKAESDRTVAKVLEGQLQVLALTALSHG